MIQLPEPPRILYPDGKTKSPRPFFSYFGGKHKIGLRYPEPKHQTIVEPFAGSAGYATKWLDHDVVLYDPDPNVFSVWNYLINIATPESIYALPEIEIRDGGPKDQKPLEDYGIEDPGAHNLIGFWLGRGSTQPAKRPGPWMRSEEYKTSFWGSHIKERIATQLPYIKHWKIEKLMYQQIPLEVVSTPSTWHLDPPYKVMGVSYKKSASAIDYNYLQWWCRSLAGQVMVCENANSGWLPWEEYPLVKLVSTRKKDTFEVIATNDDEWLLRKGYLAEYKESDSDTNPCLDIPIPGPYQSLISENQIWGRTSPDVPTTKDEGPNPAKIRRWAESVGITVAERGRISQEVVDKYLKARSSGCGYDLRSTEM